MTGRRKRDDDRSVSGKDLWTVEGTIALIRKLQSDPGLTEEFKKQAIESVKSGALEKGISIDGTPLPIKPEKKEEPLTTNQPEAQQAEPQVLTDSELNQAAVEFNAYVKFTDSVAIYPNDVSLPYATLGLSGESGEFAGKLAEIVSKNLMATEGAAVDERRDTLFQLHTLLKNIAKLSAEAEKLKKQLRKGEKKIYPLSPITEDERKALALELGDTLWYVAREAKHLGYELSEIAKMNVDKLNSRKARGVLHGNGDNR